MQLTTYRCKSCDKEFSRKRRTKRPAVYCSNECKHAAKRKQRYCRRCHAAIDCGIVCDGCRSQVPGRWTSFEDLKGDRARKFRLLRDRGHRCEICGNIEWMGQPIPIELDHVDGDSDNNAITNLRLICLNCHGQTQTYRNKNAKNRKKTSTRRKQMAVGALIRLAKRDPDLLKSAGLVQVEE